MSARLAQYQHIYKDKLTKRYLKVSQHKKVYLMIKKFNHVKTCIGELLSYSEQP